MSKSFENLYCACIQKYFNETRRRRRLKNHLRSIKAIELNFIFAVYIQIYRWYANFINICEQIYFFISILKGYFSLGYFDGIA
jgi:hypothetical protein